MSWTVTDDDNDIIQVRASINVKSQQDELLALVESLQKRMSKAIDKPKEPSNV